MKFDDYEKELPAPEEAGELKGRKPSEAEMESLKEAARAAARHRYGTEELTVKAAGADFEAGE